MNQRQRFLYLRPYAEPSRIEAGCDEAGRGCLAGPVFAAAVILPPDFAHPLLNDSKQMTPSQRNALKTVIEREAIAWAVASADAGEIDRLNILWASIQAMHRAVAALPIKPQHLIIDGNRFKTYPGIPHTCYIKGDGIFAAIAAASVLAKTHRDEYMKQQALIYPHYGWEQNMGYPTKAHREAILRSGPSPLHRNSFKLLPDSM